MTIAFSNYTKHISPDVPGCPLSVIAGFTREVVREFCDRTSYWRKDLAPISGSIGKAEYLLAVPADTELVRVPDKAYYRGNPIDPTTDEWLNARIPNWRSWSGTPGYFWMRSRNPLSIRLVPYPDEAGTGLYTSTFTAAASSDQITADTTNELYTGAMVQVSTTGTLPNTSAGLLVAGTDYFIIDISPTVKKLATSLDNAMTGTAIDLTDAGSGTHTITKNGDLVVPVSLRPTMTATGADDSVYNDHWMTIRDGVLGRAMAMPNKEWSNTTLAAAHYQGFERRIGEARMQKNMGFVSAELRVEPRRFA
jgi:hypothetical protein